MKRNLLTGLSSSKASTKLPKSPRRAAARVAPTITFSRWSTTNLMIPSLVLWSQPRVAIGPSVARAT